MKKLELMKGPFSPKEKIEYAEGVSDGIIAAAAAQDNTLDPVAARAPLQKKIIPHAITISNILKARSERLYLV